MTGGSIMYLPTSPSFGTWGTYRNTKANKYAINLFLLYNNFNILKIIKQKILIINKTYYKFKDNLNLRSIEIDFRNVRFNGDMKTMFSLYWLHTFPSLTIDCPYKCYDISNEQLNIFEWILVFKKLSFLNWFSHDDEYSWWSYLSYWSDIFKEYGIQLKAYNYFNFLKRIGLINSLFFALRYKI